MTNMDLPLSSSSYFTPFTPVIIDLSTRFVNGGDVFIEVQRPRAWRGNRVSEIHGSIVKLKHIFVDSEKDADALRIMKSNTRRGKLRFQCGWDDRPNVVSISGDDIRHLVWKDGYTGNTKYVDSRPGKLKEMEDQIANTQDFLGNPLAIGDPIIYSHSYAGMGAGVITEIKVRIRHGSPYAEIFIKSSIDNSLISITDFRQMVKLTDSIRDDVLLHKLQKAGM